MRNPSVSREEKVMPSIKTLKAFSFQGWIDANREKLKPPVGNAQVWEDGEMMVTVVGGPNNRNDYHDDPTEEFFYQLKGDIFLRLMPEQGKPPVEVTIKEGEIFLLPKHVPHSPQRLNPGTIGLVVEMPRPEGVKDGFEWYCEKCHHRVYRAEVLLKSIVRDRKSTRLNSSHRTISYAVFCLKKKKGSGGTFEAEADQDEREAELHHGAGGICGLDAEVIGRACDAVEECFFFNDTATTEIYTLSLHDALPI